MYRDAVIVITRADLISAYFGALALAAICLIFALILTVVIRRDRDVEPVVEAEVEVEAERAA
jgi:hypothetical protein